MYVMVRATGACASTRFSLGFAWLRTGLPGRARATVVALDTVGVARTAEQGPQVREEQRGADGGEQLPQDLVVVHAVIVRRAPSAVPFGCGLRRPASRPSSARITIIRTSRNALPLAPDAWRRAPPSSTRLGRRSRGRRPQEAGPASTSSRISTPMRFTAGATRRATRRGPRCRAPSPARSTSGENSHDVVAREHEQEAEHEDAVDEVLADRRDVEVRLVDREAFATLVLLDLAPVDRVEVHGAEADDRAEDVEHQQQLVETVVVAPRTRTLRAPPAETAGSVRLHAGAGRGLFRGVRGAPRARGCRGRCASSS